MWIDFSSKKTLNDSYDSLSKENKNFYWKNSIFSFLRNWFDNESLVTIYTSGTTGVPKKIFLKKKYMFERAIKTVEFLNLREKGLKGFLCLSTDFIAARMFLVRAIIFKWKIYCVEPSSNPLKNVKKFFDIASMVPMQVFYSFQYLKYIKILLIGGASISNILEKKLKNIATVCYSTYGMTETLGHIAIRKINGLNKSIFYKSFHDIHLSVDKRDCLKIFSSSCINYSIQTNDIVSMKESDKFYWIGRYDNVINSGGIKIIPELIERNISSFIPIYKRFFISSIPDKIFGERIVLIIEGDPFQFELSNIIFSGKNKFYKPKDIFFVPHFIENSLGKFNRKAIMKELIKNNVIIEKQKK